MKLTFKDVLKTLNKGSHSPELLDQVNDITSLIILCSISLVNPPAAIVGVIAHNLLLKKTVSSIGKKIISHFEKELININTFEITYTLIHFTSYFDALYIQFPILLKEVGLTESEKLFIINKNIDSSNPSIKDINDFQNYDTEISNYELTKISNLNLLNPDEYLLDLYDKLSYGFTSFIKCLAIWDKLNETEQDKISNEIKEVKIVALKNFESQLITLSSKIKGFGDWINRNEHKEMYKVLRSIDDKINYFGLIPSSLQSSAIYRNKKWKDLDPRFDLKTEIYKNQITNHFIPNSPINLELTFPQKRNQNKFQEFLNKGKIIRFKSSDLSITGSKIFETLHNETKQMFVEIRKHPLTSNLSIIFNTNNSMPEMINFTGSFFFGSKTSTFEGKALNGLLSVNLNIRNIKTISIEYFSINFDLSIWENSHFQNLIHFDLLKNFIKTIVQEQEVHSKFFIKEFEIFNGKINLTKNKLDVYNKIKILDDCRFIATHFKVNPIFSSFFELVRHKRIIRIYKEIIEKGKYIEECNNYNLSLNVYIKDEFKKNRKLYINQRYDFLLVSKSKEVDFFGENLKMGELVSLYNNWTLLNNLSENVSNDSLSEIKLKGENGTQLIIFVKPTK